MGLWNFREWREWERSLKCPNRQQIRIPKISQFRSRFFHIVAVGYAEVLHNWIFQRDTNSLSPFVPSGSSSLLRWREFSAVCVMSFRLSWWVPSTSNFKLNEFCHENPTHETVGEGIWKLFCKSNNRFFLKKNIKPIELNSAKMSKTNRKKISHVIWF